MKARLLSIPFLLIGLVLTVQGLALTVAPPLLSVSTRANLIARPELPPPSAAQPAWRTDGPQAMPAGDTLAYGLAITSTICPDFFDPPDVGVEDIQAFAAHWRLSAANPDPDDNPSTPNYDPDFDLNEDGLITIADIMLAAAQWGRACRPATLVINEVMPEGDGSQVPWAELYNWGAVPFPLQGAVLDDGDGNRYTIPAALPDVPGGAFVVVLFDGLGDASDDYDFANGVAVLHTTSDMLNPFEEVGDQLSLYRTADLGPETLLDFVAWGITPEEDDDIAVAAGLWGENAFVQAERGGLVTGSSVPGESIGRYPVSPRDSLTTGWCTRPTKPPGVRPTVFHPRRWSYPRMALWCSARTSASRGTMCPMPFSTGFR